MQPDQGGSWRRLRKIQPLVVTRRWAILRIRSPSLRSWSSMSHTP